MEENFKEDVLRELKAGNGRILLHDEVEERPGVFSIIPLWETVSEQDIMTPRDVFDMVAREGFKVGLYRTACRVEGDSSLLLSRSIMTVSPLWVDGSSDDMVLIMTSQTDEQAPLPVALAQLLERIKAGLAEADDFIFNCQMGRGRTTTGMVTACLISTITSWTVEEDSLKWEETGVEYYNSMDGPSEEEVYLQGTLPYLKRSPLTDSHTQGSTRRFCNLLGCCHMGKLRNGSRIVPLTRCKTSRICARQPMSTCPGMVNCSRLTPDSYKLKAEACEKGSGKEQKLRGIAVNYL